MLLYEVRLAFRRLLRERGFTAAAVLTLALGIGASVAVFAVVEAALLRPLPYPAAGELVVLRHRDRTTAATKPFIAIGDFLDLAARGKSLSALAAYGNVPLTIAGPDGPFRGSALLAGPGLLETLGARPVLGRALQPDDSRPGAPPVVLLGAALWRDRFGSDPQVVGRGVKVGKELRQVVGVAPDFRFPPDAAVDVVVPLTVPESAPADRKSSWTFAVGRLAPGRSPEQAGVEVALLSQQLEREHPQSNTGSQYYVVPLRDELLGDARPALLLLFAAVGVVMLIACANVANLMLARGLARSGEMAVRAALGADRSRLAVQLAAESLALAACAAALAVLLAGWGARALVALVPGSVSAPGLRDAGLDGWAAGFAVGIAALAAMLVASAASVASWGDSAGSALGGRRTTSSPAARRVGSAIVVAEVALSVVLIFGAALIARSFGRLLAVEPGFRAEGVTTADVAVPDERYPTPASQAAFFGRAFAALQAVPGVEDVGAAVVTPLTGNNWTVGLERADQPVPKGERPPEVGWQLASAGYFRVLGIPLKEGRLFDATDTATSTPVVIVSEAVERRFFPGERAVGRVVKLGDGQATIVGVVGDIRRARLTDEPAADLYLSFEQHPARGISIFVRTAPGARVPLAALVAPLREIEPGVVVEQATTMSEILAGSLRVPSLILKLLSGFAGIALLLASIGIYGVMSYVVRQRTREIGTRMALGATGRDVAWLVLRAGGLIAGLGTLVGVAAGFLASRVLESVLYATPRTDPLPMLASAAVLAVAMLLACLLPARRAARLDPARTLTEP